MKRCSKCGSEKALTEFYMNGEYRRPECKQCTLSRTRAAQPRRTEYQKAWRAENRERVRELNRLSRSRHGDKHAVRKLTEAAMQSGRLVRPDHCSECLTRGHVDAHHPNYGKPLDVTWLCKKCHGKKHRSAA